MEAEMKYRETSHYYSNKFMRNSKAVGVLWGIFTVCYAIITIVVFMQVGQVQAFCQFLWDVVFVLSFDANIFLCFQAKDGSEPYILVNIPASSEERIAQRANKGFVLTFHVSVTPKMQRGGCRSCFLLRVLDVLVNHLYWYFFNPASKIVTQGALQLFSAAGARVSHVLVNYLYLYLQVCLYL